MESPSGCSNAGAAGASPSSPARARHLFAIVGDSVSHCGGPAAGDVVEALVHRAHSGVGNGVATDETLDGVSKRLCGSRQGLSEVAYEAPANVTDLADYASSTAEEVSQHWILYSSS